MMINYKILEIPRFLTRHVFFVSSNSSRGVLSMIFGFLRNFWIDIGKKIKNIIFDDDFF